MAKVRMRKGKRQPAEAKPKHVGGGWYELPDGTRVRGKEAASSIADECQLSDVSDEA